jgi:hypothetical protein
MWRNESKVGKISVIPNRREAAVRNLLSGTTATPDSSLDSE